MRSDRFKQLHPGFRTKSKDSSLTDTVWTDMLKELLSNLPQNNYPGNRSAFSARWWFCRNRSPAIPWYNQTHSESGYSTLETPEKAWCLVGNHGKPLTIFLVKLGFTNPSLLSAPGSSTLTTFLPYGNPGPKDRASCRCRRPGLTHCSFRAALAKRETCQDAKQSTYCHIYASTGRMYANKKSHGW